LLYMLGQMDNVLENKQQELIVNYQRIICKPKVSGSKKVLFFQVRVFEKMLRCSEFHNGKFIQEN